ncbi:hypothetical protein [Roseivivax sp.]
MPLQNRVTPFGEIVADPARGSLMGNRGRLHDGQKRLGRARWRGRAWISCLLDFKGRHRPEMMMPRSYTELFFSDEWVALAAGHRPCAECRRAAYLDFRDALARACPTLGPAPRAAEMDRLLHAARTGPDARWQAKRAELPDGTFVLGEDAVALLLWRDKMWRWTSQGYEPAASVTGALTVLTPRPITGALAAGYAPLGHPFM